MMNAIEVNKKKHNIPRHGLLLCFFFAIIFTKNRLTFYTKTCLKSLKDF